MKKKLIDVYQDIGSVRKVIMDNPNAIFCLYLADKNQIQWAESTSRRYMNRIDDKIVYLPINVKRNDFEMLSNIYRLADECEQIVCVSHTHPHKSNALLKKWVNNCDENFSADIAIRQGKSFAPVDCNGPAFMEFFKKDVANFENKNVVILGVGGSGEVIARLIARENIASLKLVDLVDKSRLVEEFNKFCDVEYFSNLNEIDIDKDNIVLINCSGKEGTDNPYLDKFIEKYANTNNIFVDIRVHMTDIVNYANSLGWQGFTGYGMNVLNAYEILKYLCAYKNICLPKLDDLYKSIMDATKEARIDADKLINN